jgi:hypothetical protein
MGFDEQRMMFFMTAYMVHMRCQSGGGFYGWSATQAKSGKRGGQRCATGREKEVKIMIKTLIIFSFECGEVAMPAI